MSDKRTENLAKVRALAEKVNAGGEYLHTFEVDMVGNSGIHYQGEVSMRKATTKDIIRVGVLRGRYLQEYAPEGNVPVQYIDPSVVTLAFMLAAVKVLTVKAPEWLRNPEEVLDFEVIDFVFAKHQEWEGAFRVGSRGEPTGDSEPND